MAITVRKIFGEINLKAQKAIGQLKKFNGGMNKAVKATKAQSRSVDKLSGANNRLSKSQQKVNKGMGGFGTAIKAVGGALVLNAFKNQLVETLKAGTDFAEFQQKFNVVFGSSPELLKQAGDAVKLLGKDYGFSVVEGTKLLANTSDILTGLGTAPKAAFKMSLSVQKLAGDLASFNNVPVAQASAAITKALLGEREGVVALGIKISENAVLQKIGIKRAKGMTEVQLLQAKATATLAIAFEQSKNSLGDFKRSQDSSANQLKALNNQFIALRLEVADKILPIFDKLIAVFIKFLPNIRKPVVFIPILIAVVTVLAGALWAVVAPLLAIASPVLLVGAAIAALSIGIGFLISHWDTVRAFLIEWKGLLVLLLIPFLPIIIAIKGLVSGFKLIAANKDGIVSFFKSVWKWIKILLTPLGLLIKGFNAIGKFALNAVGFGDKGEQEKAVKVGGGANIGANKAVNDAFISKDGRVTPISDEDNISVSKGSPGGTNIQNLIGSITIQVNGAEGVGEAVKRSVKNALDELSNELEIEAGVF